MFILWLMFLLLIKYIYVWAFVHHGGTTPSWREDYIYMFGPLSTMEERLLRGAKIKYCLYKVHLYICFFYCFFPCLRTI